MIEFFRRASRNLFARIFFGLLAISFAFMWGGQDGLRMIGLSKEATVAKVGGVSISNRDLAVEIERTRLNRRLRTGQEISSEDIKKRGLDRQLLEKLINEALFKIEADRLNISVSDHFIVKMLHAQKAFQRPDGSFSKETFMRFIHNFGFRTEKDYVDYTKSKMIRARLMSALSANASLPAGATAPLFAWNEQIRTAQGMSIDSSLLVVKETPTEDQLREFYGKNRHTFVAPQRRTFKALVLDSRKVKIAIKEDDIQVIYDLERDKKYKGMKDVDARKAIREQLHHDAAQEAMIAKADKIQTEFEAGSTLKDVAQANGVMYREFVDAPLVDKKVKRSEVDQGIVAAAFVAEEAELSPLEEIQETGQYVLIYLENRKDPAQLAFGAAMADVRDAYRQEAQGALTKELVEKIQKQLDGGAVFKTVALQNKLPLVTVRVNRRKTLAPTAIDLPFVAINQLFAVPLGRPTLVPYQSKEGKTLFLIAKVTDIKNGDVAKDPKGAKFFQERLAQQVGNDVFETYVAYLKKRNSVEINKSYFEK